MRIAARGEGKLAVCLDSFDAAFRENMANCQFALHCSEETCAMSIKAFEPKFMKVGVLTAALQELTPREKRDPDPDLAIEEWVAFARELGADHIQLSAALHPTESDIPAEAM